MGKKTRFTIEILIASLVVWLVTVLFYTQEFIFSKPEASEETTQQAAPVGDLSDGTFAGTAAGHNADLEVEVVVENGEIVDVQVVNHAESEGIADPALEEVPAAIVENNSTSVDTVSGATVTSNAIMSAVNNALAGASGDDAAPAEETEVEETEAEETEAEEAVVAPAAGDYEDGTFTGVGEGHEGDVELEVVVEGGAITEINILDSSETQGISDPAFDEVPAAIIEANSTDVDTVSGATYTSNAIIEAVNSALAGDSGEAEGAYTDGTYEGTGQGYGGDILVEVTVNDGVISAIEVIDHGETQGISDAAFAEVPDAIIEANSADVDVASGASESSKGIIEAVQNALESAQ